MAHLTSTALIKQFLGTHADPYSDLQIELAADWSEGIIEDYCERRFYIADYYEWHDGTGEERLVLPNYPVMQIYRVADVPVTCMTLTNPTAVTTFGASVTDGTLTLMVVGGPNTGSSTITLSEHDTMAELAFVIEALGKGWEAYVVAEDKPRALRPHWHMADPGQTLTLEHASSELQGYSPQQEAGILTLPGGWAKGDDNYYVAYAAGYATIPSSLQMIATRVAVDILRSAALDFNLRSETLGSYSYTMGAVGGVDAFTILQHYKHFLHPWRKLHI